MKNLELKVKCPINFILPIAISKHFDMTLHQTDTYFKTFNNKRLKLREEHHKCYAILYDRPDIYDEKISNYDTYTVQDPKQFLKVFGSGLNTEIIIKKTRELYLCQNGNVRIHIDTVENLGKFIEIEVIINNKTTEHITGAINEFESHDIMDYYINILGIKNAERINLGYRELLYDNQDRFY